MSKSLGPVVVVVVASGEGSPRRLVLILVTCREMQWVFLLFLYICRGMAPVYDSSRPRALEPRTSSPGFHTGWLEASLQLDCGRPWPLCGNTATHNPAQAPPIATLSSWWPCPGLSTCLEHRYAGPALQGFSCSTVATLASIGQNKPPWPVCRAPRQPPRGVRTERGTMRKPQRFRQQKTPPANPRPASSQPLASFQSASS